MPPSLNSYGGWTPAHPWLNLRLRELRTAHGTFVWDYFADDGEFPDRPIKAYRVTFFTTMSGGDVLDVNDNTRYYLMSIP